MSNNINAQSFLASLNPVAVSELSNYFKSQLLESVTKTLGAATVVVTDTPANTDVASEVVGDPAPVAKRGRPRGSKSEKGKKVVKVPGKRGRPRKDKAEVSASDKAPRPTTKDGRSGSQFIRDYDAKRRGENGEFLAKGPEVVAACAKAGLEIAPPQVYSVRKAVLQAEKVAAATAKKAAKKAAKKTNKKAEKPTAKKAPKAEKVEEPVETDNTAQ
jgi:hypothetical protein